MIDCLFLISSEGNVFYERHWVAEENVSVLRPLLDYIVKDMTPPSIISSGCQALITLFQEDIFFTALVSREVSPFYILELLHQIKEVVESYFDTVSSKTLKEKITLVYLIIDEMFTNGIPILNWPSLVHQVVKPLSLVDKISKKIGLNTNNELSATALLEPIAWRDESVVVKQNEVLIDFVETLDMIINQKNQIVSAEVIGRIMAYVNHSGLLKITASFSRTTPLFKSVSFHPCVNMSRFSVDKILEFVPPNGSIELMAYTYKITGNCLPFIVTANQETSDIFQFNISVAPSHSLKKTVEGVVIVAHLPQDAKDCEIACLPSENCTYINYYNTLTWDIGVVSPEHPSRTITGKLKIDSECFDATSIILEVSFHMKQHTMSKSSLIKLDTFPNNSSTFKGIKYTSQSGQIELRL